MLIKLADNIYILDGSSNQSQSVRGSHMAFGNYAHPGVVAGGILGNYAGTELGDHLFPSVKKVVLEKQPNKFMGIKFGEKVVGAKVVEEGSKFRRFFANNVLRGTMGALGTGAGAMLVANLRKNKNKDPQMVKQASVEKLAPFLNKRAMDLSIVTPMAENDAVNTAASAMNTNSLAKRFRQPGLVKMPSFGGSNVISPSVANFKQYGA